MKCHSAIHLLLCIFLVSCHDKEPSSPDLNPVPPTVRRSIIPPPKKSLIFKSQPLDKIESKATYNFIYHSQEMQKMNLDKLKLVIERLKYPGANVFVYHYETYSDTLEIYKDSVRFNSRTAKKLGSKLFLIKGDSVKVDKYDCSGRSGPPAIWHNLFINSPQGLIFNKVIAYYSGFKKYNIGLDALQNHIQNDTVFFKYYLGESMRRTK